MSSILRTYMYTKKHAVPADRLKRESSLNRFLCGMAHNAQWNRPPTASVNSGLKGRSEGRASWERRVETSVTLEAGSVSGCARGLLGEPRRGSGMS
ncbi:hypothetical protein CGRA01v4_11953 [Colletotrichum graminicola]|nr:hypothetical protein CGRA01v4_11953 [Colletotrichum graminicola]